MELVLRLITFIADFAVYLLFPLFLYKTSTISTKSKAYTQQGFRLSITLLTIELQKEQIRDKALLAFKIL